MKPQKPRPPRALPLPSSEPARREFIIPEGKALRELRHTLARGGLPPASERTPEQDARIVEFRTLQELLRILDQFRRRIEAGEKCRLVERDHPWEPGRFFIEFVIEVQP